jgi:photosystem II stability/assembly factor-like uncharacterized protein
MRQSEPVIRCVSQRKETERVSRPGKAQSMLARARGSLAIRDILMKQIQPLLLACLLVLLTGCGKSTGQATTSLTPAQVNGFGTAANHVHSLVILPDAYRTLVLATHYGIFRSQDHGKTWQETAGGPGQLMQGVMTYDLSYSPLDPRRLYVLTYYQTGPLPRNALGLYTSSDSGKTWQLSLKDTAITTSTIFFAQAGNQNPSQVYIYLREPAAHGLLVSSDHGQHFSPAGSPLPFGSLLGLLVVPGQSGHLFAYGDEGIASTQDAGAHWRGIPGIEGSIFEMTTPRPNGPVYAEGDAGVYASSDGGQHFALVYTRHSYSSLTASPQNPSTIYGKLGLGVYRSSDGGKNWSPLPAIEGNLQVLAVDPANAGQVYLALSYPTRVYYFQAANHAWQSLTPSV